MTSLAVSSSTPPRRPQITQSAQLDELIHHDPAQPGAAAGDEEALSLEQIGPKHQTLP